MVSIQASTFLVLSSSSFSNKKTIKSGVNYSPQYIKYPKITIPKLPNNNAQKQQIIEELNQLAYLSVQPKQNAVTHKQKHPKISMETLKLYAILEAVSDRIEMHHNIREQRENWNSMLLNSINMMTLTALTMAGLAEASGCGPHGLGLLKVSSTLLFAAATGVVLIMNKIQPSQLVEEQRNAVRLFKQLKSSLETKVSLQTATLNDVEDAMERVLALDKAYPLPLLGEMLDKYPTSLEPAVWWPSSKRSSSLKDGEKNKFFGVNETQREGMRIDPKIIRNQEDSSNHLSCPSVSAEKKNNTNNGWSMELEKELKEIIGVTKSKDMEDYVRLGNKALQLSKVLGVLGPVLTGVAGVGAAFVGNCGPWGGLVAGVAGSMAVAVNTIEHGGQVGMVFEMYRNCAGFFKLLEETVESTLEEGNVGKRENGEVFELKMALHLGRSLSELRDLADKSRKNGGSVDEFASKLF